MKCADAREMILSADHAALRDRTDATLRQHLERCAECSAAASHVVADVSRLRAALIARGARAIPAARARRTSTKRVAMTLVPIALAAELAAFAFIGSRDNPNPLLDRNRVIDDSVTSLLPASMHIDTGEVVAAKPVAPKNSHVSTVKQVAVARDTAHDAADSTNGNYAPFEHMSSAEMTQLQVVPQSRTQRVAVIGTSNPKITVVWLSRDSL
jgi:hypothetical protein